LLLRLFQFFLAFLEIEGKGSFIRFLFLELGSQLFVGAQQLPHCPDALDYAVGVLAIGSAL
jgi:hypothetical protein